MEFAVRANRISPAKVFELRRLLDVEWPGWRRHAQTKTRSPMAKEIERMRVNG